MDDPVHFFATALIMGLGATLCFDLWGLALKWTLGIPPSNICLVGRWMCGMPKGAFRHANIAASPPLRAECAVGWIAHYLIGITFALAFAALAGHGWLEHPTPLPAVLFGVLTVAAPFCIMQPAFGLGIAASKSPHPAQARLRSLLNHAAFGVGLYLFALLANVLARG